MNRFLFAAGLAIGFVLGARAGKGRYEQIKRTAQRVAESEQVRTAVDGAQQALDYATPRVSKTAREFAECAQERSKKLVTKIGDGAAQIAGAASEGAKNLASRMTDQAEDLQSRVTLTAEDLRKRSEDQIDEVKRRIEEERERSRDATSEQFVRIGEARDEALETFEDEADDMFEPEKPRP